MGGVYKEPKRTTTAKKKSAVPPSAGSSSGRAASEAGDGGGAGAEADAGGETDGPIKRSVRASTKNKVLFVIAIDSTKRSGVHVLDVTNRLSASCKS